MSQKNETPVLIFSLLITVALVAAGFWWFTRRSGFNLNQVTQPSSTPSSSSNTSPAASAPNSLPTNQPSQASQSGADDFSSVQNVPSGLFNYGGSTTWAPIRGHVDPTIQTVFPNFRLRYTEPVTGTPGSSTGIRMLLNNELTFSQSSRAPKPEEYQEAQQRGFILKEIPVAMEGIAIAVNPSLNIPGLTLEQLKGIYTGRITNWSQVGGADLPITPYSRQLGDSGTVEFFAENILGGQNFGSNVKFVSTTTQALREVSDDPGGLYYASAPEVVGQCTTKPIAIGRRSNELIPPYQTPLIPPSQCPAQRNQINEAALQSGQYPITRRLFVLIKQDNGPDQQAGEAYANLLLTGQGQELLRSAGFVRIR